MRILFIHPNFPAQFRHVATVLGRNSDHQIVFATANPRPEWHIKGVQKAIFQKNDNPPDDRPILSSFLQTEAIGESVLQLCRQLKKEGFIPDVIYGHSGWGTTWFIRDVFPLARQMSYFEWFYQPDGADTLFGRMEPVDPAHRAGLRIKNTPIVNDLLTCDLGVSPTAWQKTQLPEQFHHKIMELHDGIDTDYFKPDPRPDLKLPHLDLAGVKKIVTYAARGMEPYRGFPQMIEALAYILEQDKECHVVIAASERTCYGNPPPGGKSYKDIMLAKVPLDLSRVHFVGTLPYKHYLKILQASSVHIYLTRPFVLSWSVLEAMSCGCVVVASDTEPVREVIQDGVNGILTDFFSPKDIATKVINTLSYPRLMTQIKARARQTIQNRYDLKKLLPRHVDLIVNSSKDPTLNGPLG